jgi:hypothetical protein
MAGSAWLLDHAVEVRDASAQNPCSGGTTNVRVCRGPKRACEARCPRRVRVRGRTIPLPARSTIAGGDAKAVSVRIVDTSRGRRISGTCRAGYGSGSRLPTLANGGAGRPPGPPGQGRESGRAKPAFALPHVASVESAQHKTARSASLSAACLSLTSDVEGTGANTRTLGVSMDRSPRRNLIAGP